MRVRVFSMLTHLSVGGFPEGFLRVDFKLQCGHVEARLIPERRELGSMPTSLKCLACDRRTK